MTGFQTCALPIFGAGCFRESASAAGLARPPGPGQDPDAQEIHAHNAAWFHASLFGRSLTPPHAVAPPAIVLRIPTAVLNLSPRRLRLWRSEEHTSELQSLMRTSYAVFCLKITQS